MTVTELIKRAAALMGDDAKLAKAIGAFETPIWQAKSRGRAHQRKGRQYQIGLRDDAADPIVPDEIIGLSRARHLPKLVRQ